MSAFTRGLTFQLQVLGVTTAAGPSPNGAYIKQLGGLSSAEQVEVVSTSRSTDMWLTTLSHSDVPGPQVSIVHPEQDRVNACFVEVRHPSGWDRGIGAQTVLMHEIRPGEGRTFLRAGPDGRGLRSPGHAVTSSDGSLVVELLQVDVPGKKSLVRLSAALSSQNRAWTHEPFYGERAMFFADLTGDGRADAIVVNNDKVVARLAR